MKLRILHPPSKITRDTKTNQKEIQVFHFISQFNDSNNNLNLSVVKWKCGAKSCHGSSGCRVQPRDKISFFLGYLEDFQWIELINMIPVAFIFH